LGTSSILNVVLVQRDTTTRELSEVDARNQYIRARSSLQQVLGTTLEDHNVNIDEARKGVVGREPDLIPAVGRVR
jgi:outer membrane protein TolC